MKAKQVIKCPNCGAEYLPSEIYYRDEISGKAMGIQKDETGKILNFTDKDYTPVEHYECDICGEKLTVTVTTTYTVDSKKKLTNETLIKKDTKSTYILDENI